MKVYIVVKGNYALSSNMQAFSSRELADGFKEHLRRELGNGMMANVFEMEVDGAVLKEEDM